MSHHGLTVLHESAPRQNGDEERNFKVVNGIADFSLSHYELNLLTKGLLIGSVVRSESISCGRNLPR